MSISKYHEMFYGETGIEISVSIDRALKMIMKQMKIDKDSIKKQNIAMMSGLEVIESEYVKKGICVIGTGQYKF